MSRRRSKRRKKRQPTNNNQIIYAASYARVSSEMQRDNFSVNAQHKANGEFASRKGWLLYNEYTDVGSGTNMERPAFQQMLDDAKGGRFQHIICHKLDRFSRSVLDTLDMLQELDELGVTFSSSTEQFDFTTPIGKVLLTLLAAFAELYIDNLRTEVIKGQTARAEAGFWMQRLSFGYTTKKEILESKNDDIALTNLLEAENEAKAKEKYIADATAIQDRNASGVKLMFELARSGQVSLQDIANELHEKGYLPTRRAGKRTLERWTKDSVAKALKNKFYAGYVLYRGKYYLGNHEPIITREEFDQAQEAMSRRDKKRWIKTQKKSRIYLLSGLMTCARCGNPIRSTYRTYTTKRGEQIEYRYYRCSARFKGSNCDLENVAASDLEPAIARFFMKMRIPENWQDRILAHIHSHIESSQATISHLRTRLNNLKILFELGDLTPDEYKVKRDEIKDKIVSASPEPINPSLDKIVAIIQDLKLFWLKAKPEERQKLMQSLIERIELDQTNEMVIARLTINPSARLLFHVALEDESGEFEIIQERERKGKKKK